MEIIVFDILQKAYDRTLQWYKSKNLWPWLLRLTLVLFLLGKGLRVSFGYRQGLIQDHLEDSFSFLEQFFNLELVLFIAFMAVILSLIMVFIRSVLEFMFLDFLIEKKQGLIDSFRSFLGKGFNLFLFRLPVSIGIFIAATGFIFSIIGIIGRIALYLMDISWMKILNLFEEALAAIFSTIPIDPIFQDFFMGLFKYLWFNPWMLFILAIICGLLGIFLFILGYLVYLFGIPLMYLKNKNIIDAISSSLKLARENILQVIIYAIVVLILSILAFSIGWVITFILSLPVMILVVIINLLPLGDILILVFIVFGIMVSFFLSLLGTLIFSPAQVFLRYLDLGFLEALDEEISITPEEKKVESYAYPSQMTQESNAP